MPSPPRLQAAALQGVTALLLASYSGILLVGGDFNDVLEVCLDRSAPGTGLSGSTGLASFADTLGLVDLWCRVHPHDRHYSYFSGARSTTSRLDYFFSPAEEVQEIVEVEYKARGLSDHSPL
mgnify:CR=1 FL=1